VNIYIYYYFK